VERDSFPRQAARTRRFTLGQPRSFTVAKDGSRVAFLRSPAGDDPNTCLWTLDVDTGRERLVADPRALPARGDGAPSPEERARRERARETAGGIVQYAADPGLRTATFVAGGVLYAVDISTGGIHTVENAPDPFDPRPDPTLRWVAYASGRALRVASLQASEASGDRLLVQEDDPDISWGVAEFVAAEEMDRLRGHWWSPDGTAIAAARVDVGPVPTRHRRRWPTRPQERTTPSCPSTCSASTDRGPT
jgi:dipeptidyl-peptidase-4